MYALPSTLRAAYHTYLTARCLLALFGTVAGYPIAEYFTKSTPSVTGAFNLGGVNMSGQVPEMIGSAW